MTDFVPLLCVCNKMCMHLISSCNCSNDVVAIGSVSPIHRRYVSKEISRDALVMDSILLSVPICHAETVYVVTE